MRWHFGYQGVLSFLLLEVEGAVHQNVKLAIDTVWYSATAVNAVFHVQNALDI